MMEEEECNVQWIATTKAEGHNKGTLSHRLATSVNQEQTQCCSLSDCVGIDLGNMG